MTKLLSGNGVRGSRIEAGIGINYALMKSNGMYVTAVSSSCIISGSLDAFNPAA
jgi:hypothetical protein